MSLPFSFEPWMLWVVLAVMTWLRLKPRQTVYGSAGWMSIWKAVWKGLFRRQGIYLGDWFWGLLPVWFSKEGHIWTWAPPGGGKSTSCSIPSGLSRQRRYKLVIDPGLEITAVCIKDWRAAGYDVFVVNPAGNYQEAPWNLPMHGTDPMAFIDMNQPQEIVKKCRRLADTLISLSGREDGSSEYFKSDGKEKIAAWLAWERLHGGNLVTFREGVALSESGLRDLWEEMRESDLCNGWIANQAADWLDMVENAGEQFQAVLSTIRVATAWLDDPQMREVVLTDEVDWGALKGVRKNGKRNRGCVVAIGMPRQDWKQNKAFVRLAYLSAIWTLEEDPVAKDYVHVLIEEFPTLGAIPSFSDDLATVRKRKVQIEIVTQNIGQMETAYPHDWKAMVPEFEVHRILGVRDVDTAKHVSESLGKKTVIVTDPAQGGTPPRKHFGSRELLTPDEVRRLPEKRQIVLMGRARPMRLRKTPYWERPEFRGRFYPNPHYGKKTPRLPLKTPIRKWAGRLVKWAAYLLAPHPVVAAVYLAAGVFWFQPGVKVEGGQGASCTYITPVGLKSYRANGQDCPAVVFERPIVREGWI